MSDVLNKNYSLLLRPRDSMRVEILCQDWLSEEIREYRRCVAENGAFCSRAAVCKHAVMTVMYLFEVLRIVWRSGWCKYLI